MIDTMCYSLYLPAGTYSAGVPVEVPLVRGSSVVRDGYGPAILKRVFNCYMASSANYIAANLVVANSSWNDSMTNLLVPCSSNNAYTILSAYGPAIQSGANCPVIANSTFSVQMVPVTDFTTDAAVRVIVLIDIDYPQVAAVANPKNENGIPMTIVRKDQVSFTGSADANIKWATYNVDLFKAGYRYLLVEAGFTQYDAGAAMGLLAISGAASQAGLVQIIPVSAAVAGATRYPLDYSTVMVKGPMNLEYAVIASGNVSNTHPVYTELDFIKRE